MTALIQMYIFLFKSQWSTHCLNSKSTFFFWLKKTQTKIQSDPHPTHAQSIIVTAGRKYTVSFLGLYITAGILTTLLLLLTPPHPSTVSHARSHSLACLYYATCWASGTRAAPTPTPQAHDLIYVIYTCCDNISFCTDCHCLPPLPLPALMHQVSPTSHQHAHTVTGKLIHCHCQSSGAPAEHRLTPLSYI